jgi:hypothetical protein
MEPCHLSPVNRHCERSEAKQPSLRAKQSKKLITMFTITRIFSDENGDSHFQDLGIPLSGAGDIGLLSEAFAAKSVIFREVLPSYDYDFHNAPRRQYIILLDGEIEIETSLGDKRRFRGGEILLVEDTTGHGHRTRNIIPTSRKSVFIALD